MHVILGLSVWCIYLADRLYDATRAKDTSQSTDRLRFTKNHIHSLSVLTVFAGCLNLYLIVSHVPWSLIVSGLGTAFLLILYYLFRLFGRGRLTIIVPREILCGMIFALGSVLAVDYYAALATVDLGFVIPVILFGLLCSASCILISIWERDADMSISDVSFATRHGSIPPLLAPAISLLSIVCVILAFLGIWQIYLALALSALSLRLMLHFEKFLSVATLRVLADAVLLSPLLLIAFT